MTVDDLDAYERVVSRLADSKSDVVFYNTGVDHAKVVVKNIFEHSTKNINVLINSFDDKIYNNDDIIFALERFLKNGGKLNIIFDNYHKIDIQNTIVKICQKYLSNVNTYILKNKKKFHYITADGKMYRYMYDKKENKAEFSFNSPDKVSLLDKDFLEIIKLSDPIYIIDFKNRFVKD